MHAGVLFLAPSPDPVGYVIMTEPRGSIPSRLIIGATHLDALLILERANTTGLDTNPDPARIVPVTAAQYRAATGRTMHPIRMQSSEAARRITGRARTA